MRKDITTLLGQAMALTIDIDKKGIRQMSMTCYGILGIDIAVHYGISCNTIARINFDNNKDTKNQIKTNWKGRLQAVQEMKKYDCQQIRDVITRLALHDRVYKVKEEAFRVAQVLGITKQGKPIRLGKKI